MKIVLDTNVLVSGLLSPFGKCGEIVRMLVSNGITVCVDARILIEYGEVLRRPHFRMDPHKVDAVIDYIRVSSETHPTMPLATPLPDADDNQFLEVALSAEAECLVTGNTKHYPAGKRAGVRVLTPAEFLDYFTDHRTTR